MSSRPEYRLFDVILAGRAFRPGDSGYDAVRGPVAVASGVSPSLIVRAADAIDVRIVVELARSAGLELAVRAGGHSLAGHSMVDGGIVLDLADLRQMHVIREPSMAWVGAGLTAGAFTRHSAAYGLVTDLGTVESLGIAGLTLGGGIGWLVRKYGLAIDNLLAAEVVTADGEHQRVSADKYPDLFWALRGGAGNFGVVTRFAFRLHPVETVLGGVLVLPATPEVLHSFMAAADAAPDELTTIARLAPAPPLASIPAERRGELVLLVTLVHAGDPVRARRDIATLRDLATLHGRAEPIVDAVRPMAYPEVYGLPTGDGTPNGPGAMRSTFIDRIDLDAAATMINQMHRAPSGRAVMQIRVLGGAMARVAPDATAFAHRQRAAMVTAAAAYGERSDGTAEEAWAIDSTDAMPGSGRGVYVNFLGHEGPARVREAYPGGTYQRLAAIKRRYDPTNLFRWTPNIDPAPLRGQ